MNAERWQKIKRLFDRAQEIEPFERERFLEANFGGDEDLRAEVEKLLASLADAEGFLENPADVADVFDDKI